MHRTFHNRVRSVYESGNVLAGSPVISLTWPYSEQTKQKPIMLNSLEASDWADIVVVSPHDVLTDSFLKTHELFALDEESNLRAFKRKMSTSERNIQNVKTVSQNSKEEYLPLLTHELDDTLTDETIKVRIQTTITRENNTDQMFLVYSLDDEEKNYRYVSVNLPHYFDGRKNELLLDHSWILTNKKLMEKQLKIYIWNPNKGKLNIHEGYMELSVLKKE